MGEKDCSSVQSTEWKSTEHRILSVEYKQRGQRGRSSDKWSHVGAMLWNVRDINGGSQEHSTTALVTESPWPFPNPQMSEPAVGLCLCELASGLVRKLQGTEAKSQTRPCLCELISGLVRKPDVQKSSIQSSQMASYPSDVNKKVMLLLLLCSHFKGDITKS
jgi:hypothetical protein